MTEDDRQPRARRDLPRRRQILRGRDAPGQRYACLGVFIRQCGPPPPALRFPNAFGTDASQMSPASEGTPSSLLSLGHIGRRTSDLKP
jgi:hypothetical protein